MPTLHGITPSAATQYVAASPSLASRIEQGHFAEIEQAGSAVKLTLNLRDDGCFVFARGRKITVATQVNGSIVPRGMDPKCMWPFKGPAQAVSAERPIAADERAAVKSLVSFYADDLACYPDLQRSAPLFRALVAALG